MPTLFDPDAAVGFARVAVERGLDRYPEGLTYAVPPDLADLAVGDRVQVPLGPSDTPTPGYVIEIVAAADLSRGRIKPVRERDPRLGLPPQLVELARWISSYYCAPIGMTLAAVTPAAVKRKIGMVSRTMIDLCDGAEVKLPSKQKHTLEVLRGLDPEGRPIEMRRLAELAGLGTTAPIRRLVERGLVTGTSRSTVEAAWIEQAVDRSVPLRLTPRQQEIVELVGLELGRGFSAHLLFGVTGSGKTEIYIRLIERVVAAGKVAVVLVPEIALTPQTGGRLVGRFPRHRVSIQHSGLTAAQRHQQWALAADGTADIVLGARSAVFAPVPDGRLGLVIVDEEHDGSYKQDQVPRYHGRDVAVRRAQIAGCPVLLGSATPSMESWHNATARGTYRLHRIEERVPGLRVPRIQIVDFVAERRRRQRGSDRHLHLLGPTLENALAETLEQDGQALLLLNRRGYANYIACPDRRCGWLLCCDHCDATMVYHVDRQLPAGGYVQCHHCRTQQQLPRTCPVCGRRVTPFGLGTQRVEAELERKFPQLADGTTMLRVDSDSMHGAADFHRALKRFGAGEIRILLGTQMIAKGLDFPRVRLVGVINADTAVNLPDFRATERTYQLVSQVAGRCGRGREPGRVIVQTFHPRSPAIKLAAAHDYETFARLELAERHRCMLPPYTRMARIVVRDRDFARCVDAAKALAAALRDLIATAAVRVRGPAPCPIARISGRHRQQIELSADTARDLQGLLSTARSEGLIKSGAAMAIDVDPIALM